LEGILTEFTVVASFCSHENIVLVSCEEFVKLWSCSPVQNGLSHQWTFWLSKTKHAKGWCHPKLL